MILDLLLTKVQDNPSGESIKAQLLADFRSIQERINVLNGVPPTLLPLVWYTPIFANAWVDFGSAAGAQYAIDDGNTVFIKGLVKSGSNTAWSLIFTLPVGFRPLSQITIAAATFGGAGRLDILPSGDVVFVGSEPHTGDVAGYLSITASFKAEQ